MAAEGALKKGGAVAAPPSASPAAGRRGDAKGGAAAGGGVKPQGRGKPGKFKGVEEGDEGAEDGGIDEGSAPPGQPLAGVGAAFFMNL